MRKQNLSNPAAFADQMWRGRSFIRHAERLAGGAGTGPDADAAKKKLQAVGNALGCAGDDAGALRSALTKTIAQAGLDEQSGDPPDDGKGQIGSAMLARRVARRLAFGPASGDASKTLEAVGKALGVDPTDATALRSELDKTIAKAGLDDQSGNPHDPSHPHPKS